MFSLYLLFIHDKDDMKGSESTNSIVDMLKSALVQRQKTTPIATQKQKEGGTFHNAALTFSKTNSFIFLKSTLYLSLCLNFFHLLAKRPNLELFSIYSNKFFHNCQNAVLLVPGFGQVG